MLISVNLWTEKEIKIPIVIINSRIWPTNLEANRKHIRNYKNFYINDTGHFPMLENPKKFNGLFKKAIEYVEEETSNKNT